MRRKKPPAGPTADEFLEVIHDPSDDDLMQGRRYDPAYNATKLLVSSLEVTSPFYKEQAAALLYRIQAEGMILPVSRAIQWWEDENACAT